MSGARMPTDASGIHELREQLGSWAASRHEPSGPSPPAETLRHSLDALQRSHGQVTMMTGIPI